MALAFIRVSDRQVTVMVFEWRGRHDELPPGKMIRFLEHDDRTYAVQGVIDGSVSRRAPADDDIIASAHF